MPPIVIDLVTAVLIAGMTYALASEGLWGAALMFFNALFAGIIAFNCYEPLAAMLAQNVSAMGGFADSLCLLVIFCVALIILRLTTDSIGPTMVRFPMPLFHLGRWLFGFLAACVTMAILLLGFHTAPVHKKMFYGAYPYDHKPPFGMGLDWQWLGFFQYTTGSVFARHDPNNPIDPHGEYGNARVFDPRGAWLIIHQNSRYGDGAVPDPNAAGASGGGAAGGEAAAGGASGAPAAAGGRPGPGIPGGTAGAAVGLAPTTP